MAVNDKSRNVDARANLNMPLSWSIWYSALKQWTIGLPLFNPISASNLLKLLYLEIS